MRCPSLPSYPFERSRNDSMRKLSNSRHSLHFVSMRPQMQTQSVSNFIKLIRVSQGTGHLASHLDFFDLFNSFFHHLNVRLEHTVVMNPSCPHGDCAS